MPEALIWGASGGIGQALVRQLKVDGWRVYGAARQESRVPPEVDRAVHFDAGSPDSISAAAMIVAQETDGIDLMVYTAGAMQAVAIEDMHMQDWQRIMDANLTGAYLTTQGALGLLRESAHVAYIGAYVDKLTLPRFGAYAAAKAGLETLAGVLQKEHRQLKFTVVRPGAVDTPFWDDLPFKLPKGAIEPQAVAAAVIERYRSGEKGLLDLH